MKKFQISLLGLVLALLVTTGCGKTVLENQSASDQDTPATSDTSSTDTMAGSDTDTQSPASQTIGSSGTSTSEADIKAAVYFDFDSAMLDSQDQSLLQIKAQWLQENPQVVSILVEGHCDERGTDAYNMALGARRADAVKDYLINLGIQFNKLETQSYGEEKPAVPGHDEAAWSKNRRASFVIN